MIGAAETHRDTRLAQAINAIGNNGFAGNLAGYIRACINYDNLIVIAYQGEATPEILFREFVDPVVYQHIDDVYVTANYVLDPFYKAHLQGVHAGLHRLFDLAPDRFKQTSYFKTYYEQTTLVDEVAVFARTRTGITITVCIGTDQSSGRTFKKNELFSLKNTAATIAALVESHWQKFQMKQSQPKGPVVDRLRQILADLHNVQLSPRQAEVAMLVLQGHSSTSISLNLGVSMHTVKVFRRQLYAKCAISSQAQLFVMLLPLISDR